MNLERALVTNALSPLGRQLAHELAAHGHPLVLVGSDQVPLEQLGAALGATFNVELRWFVVELEDPGGPAQIFTNLAEDGLAIDILANNIPAGEHGAFLASTLEQDVRILRAQLETSVGWLKLFLTPMAQRQQGRILNVFAQQQSALQQASAAFIRTLMESLLPEVTGLGITASTFCVEGADLDSGPGLEKLGRAAYRGLMAGEGFIR